MPTVYNLGGTDDSDQGDRAASDPVVAQWDDKHVGKQLYVFADQAVLREGVRKPARPN
jgi:hypothetical protein